MATAILIAITLIAAIAIAGFVFGLFGSFTSTAQVSASVTNITAAVGVNAAAAGTCSTTAPGAGTSFIQFRNTGTSNADVQSISFTFGGKTLSTAITAPCTVTAGGTTYVTETGLGGAAGSAVAGSQFTGSASMSNGGSVSFTGTFG